MTELPRLFQQSRSGRKIQVPTRIWNTVFFCIEYPDGVFIDTAGIPRPEEGVQVPSDLETSVCADASVVCEMSTPERREQRDMREDVRGRSDFIDYYNDEEYLLISDTPSQAQTQPMSSEAKEYGSDTSSESSDFDDGESQESESESSSEDVDDDTGDDTDYDDSSEDTESTTQLESDIEENSQHDTPDITFTSEAATSCKQTISYPVHEDEPLPKRQKVV
jgi:hypothetical protein